MDPTNGLRRRLLLMIATRVVLITIALGWAVLAGLRDPSVADSTLFVIIGLTYALNGLYAAALGATTRLRWIADLQLAADVLVVSAFVAATGGVGSYFPSLYALPIIAASLLQSRRGAVLLGVLATLTYAGIVVAQYQAPGLVPAANWLRLSDGALLPAHVAVYTVALNGAGLLVVALLAGALSKGLQRAGAEVTRASTELAHVQAENQDIIDSLASGLITTDHAGRVLTFNRAAEAITGHAAGSVAGRPVADVLQLPPKLVAGLAEGLDGARAWREDYTYRTGDDRLVEIGLSAMHLVTHSGRAGFLFNFQDVTGVKKLARDARLQHRLAAVGEMAAGIAHEIRNPLASISGSIQILRQELRLSEEQGQLMDIVLRESERLNGIIRTFLAYARPQRFAITRVDVGHVLADAALLLRNSADVREGHTIDVQAGDGQIWYDADEGQLRQIIWNLATNGLRAMPGGGRLRLQARNDPGRDRAGDAIPGSGDLVLVVEDEGIGIEPGELDEIFQPFHGAFAHGSGLGLSIVHRIVTDYDGEIQVTSRPGAGTTVRVRLPARSPVAAA